MKRGAPHHPKTADLAGKLKVCQSWAVGILESLWHWAAVYCPDGAIRYSAEVVADTCWWPHGDADRLMKALIQTGWLDQTEQGWELVDWLQYWEGEPVFYERDLEEGIAKVLHEYGFAFARQVRSGRGYADIVIQEPHVVMELKWGALDNNTIKQVMRYAVDLQAIPCLFGIGVAKTPLVYHDHRTMAILVARHDGLQMLSDGGWLNKEHSLFMALSQETFRLRNILPRECTRRTGVRR